MAYLFPFGQELHPLVQQDQREKRIFVLGVYASAVHARWRRDGKVISQALAVASEPRIFWDGDPEEAEMILRKIQLPEGAGCLEPADRQFNGPSAKVLDEHILSPLGFAREDAWLCDLLPETRLNSNQCRVIQEQYNPLIARLGLNPVTVPPRPSVFCDGVRAAEITAELLKSNAELLVLLGDLPIQQYMNRITDADYSGLQEYAERFGYGNPSEVTVCGKTIRVLPLAHPRQIGALGAHSEHWRRMHRMWEQAI